MKNKNTLETFIFNFNGKNTILSTIESLYNSEDVDVSVTVIDDHSTDDSLDMVRKCYPNVSVFQLPYNTKKLNILRNKALELSKGEIIFITDNDIKFDKRCLSELLNIMKSDEQIATCNPRLMHWDQPEKVYSADTKVHFIGGAISEYRDKQYVQGSHRITSNSGGGICLLRREAALKVGGYDQNFMLGWGDDGEFFQRLLRAGYKCLYVPQAFALHENKISEILRKYRVTGQTYNRLLFMLSHYSIPLIILLTPAFIIYELLQIGFVLLKGVPIEYIKGNLLILKNFPLVLKKRKAVQKIKIVSDKEVLFPGDLYVAPALIQKSKLLRYSISAFSSGLNIYWALIKKIIP